MGTQPTQKILEELNLLEMTEDTVVEFDEDETQKINNYWRDKKTRKQLLKDMSEYADNIFYMFSVFLKGEEDEAVKFVVETGKRLYTPQLLVKKSFESEDEQLLTPEVIYHTLYFAKQFELSEDRLKELSEENPDLIAKLKVESKSLSNWFKRILVEFKIFKKLFALLHIDLPPDFTEKEIEALEMTAQEEETDVEGSKIATEADSVRSLKESKKVSESQEISHSNSRSIKTAKPKKDKSLRHEEKSDEVPHSLSEIDISSIHANSDNKANKNKQADRSQVPIIPFQIPESDENQRVFHESIESAQEAEEEREQTRSPSTISFNPIVPILPFSLGEAVDDKLTVQIPEASLSKGSPNVSIATVLGSLVAKSKDSPKPSVGIQANATDLSKFYGSPTLPSSDQVSATAFLIEAAQVPKLAERNSIAAAPTDLSKFYKVSSKPNFVSPARDLTRMLEEGRNTHVSRSPVKAATSIKSKTPQSERIKPESKSGLSPIDPGFLELKEASFHVANSEPSEGRRLTGFGVKRGDKIFGQRQSFSFFDGKSPKEGDIFGLEEDVQGHFDSGTSFIDSFVDEVPNEPIQEGDVAREIFRSPSFLLTAKRPEFLGGCLDYPNDLEVIQEEGDAEADHVEIKRDNDDYSDDDQDEEQSEEESQEGSIVGASDVPDFGEIDPHQSVEFKKDERDRPGDVEDFEDINPYDSIDFERGDTEDEEASSPFTI